jgi:adenylate cyclase class IV
MYGMSDIEIEKKFLLTPDQEAALLTDAEELGQKVVEDIYFDTKTYDLTTHNQWLRKRDGAFELKTSLKTNTNSQSGAVYFRELTIPEEIADELGLSGGAALERELERGNIQPFMTVITNRTSYQKQGFHIDIDTATYGDSSFTYAVAEIELLIDNEADANTAEQHIITFAKKFNLTTDKIILGKVAAYLKTEDPTHYKVLERTGIFK